MKKKNFRTSAKLERLLELTQELVAEDRRILIFSQFTSMLAIISQQLTQHGIVHRTFSGETTNREALVHEFQSGSIPVLLVSLKAGGVGLNLTEANTVIHYDPWWNPAAESQATDRAHRLGQTKAVFVYKLIAANSVEERILELQRRKAQLTESVFLDGAVREQLTRADLENLFAPMLSAM